jgi:Domain of unknown function (DUF1707)
MEVRKMADQLRYSRRHGPRNRQLRVGNDEREAVADILRREHVAGRLDTNEFDERLDRCLAARTYADLDELIADLPAADGEQWQPPRLAWRWRPWPVLLLPVIVFAIVFSHGRATWLLVPFFLWFVVRPFIWGYGWRGSSWRGYGWRRGPSLGRRI